MNLLIVPFLVYSVLPASDWPLIAGIITQESGWNPHAVSSAGAKGLMQLTPIAVEEAKRECPKARRYHLDLFNPRTNVWLGTCLIKRLRRVYGYDTRELLAHYNGGFRAVNALRKGEPLSVETKRYVNSVPLIAAQYGWKDPFSLAWE